MLRLLSLSAALDVNGRLSAWLELNNRDCKLRTRRFWVERANWLQFWGPSRDQRSHDNLLARPSQHQAKSCRIFEEEKSRRTVRVPQRPARTKAAASGDGYHHTEWILQPSEKKRKLDKGNDPTSVCSIGRRLKSSCVNHPAWYSVSFASSDFSGIHSCNICLVSCGSCWLGSVSLLFASCSQYKQWIAEQVRFCVPCKWY